MTAIPQHFDLEVLETRVLLSADGVALAVPLENPVVDTVEVVAAPEDVQDASEDNVPGIFDGVEELGLAPVTPVDAADSSTTETADSSPVFDSVDLTDASLAGPSLEVIADPFPGEAVDTLIAANPPPVDAPPLSDTHTSDRRQSAARASSSNHTLTPSDIEALHDGLSGVVEIGEAIEQTGLVAQTLPFIGLNIGASLEFGALLNEHFFTPIDLYLNGSGSKDSDGLVTVLQGLDRQVDNLEIIVDDISVSGGLVDGTELRFDLIFQATRTIVDVPISLNPDATSFSTGGVALADTVFSLLMDFSFGVNPADSPNATDAFFIEVNAFSMGVEIHESDLGSTINIGLLGADLQSGQIDLDAEVEITFANPDNDPAGQITLSELLGTSLENLVTMTPTTSSLTGQLDLMATLGDFSTGDTLITLSGDPFDPAGPTVDITGAQASEILNFTQLGPAGMVGTLQQVGNWLGTLSVSDFVSTRLPFTEDALLGNLVHFETLFQEELTSPLVIEPGRYSFANAQELADELASLLSLDPGVVDVQYDPATDRLSYHLEISHAFDPVSVPLMFVEDLGPVNSIDTSSQLTLQPSGTLSLTIQLQLTNTSVSLTGNQILPGDGRLSGDAHFDLSVNGSPVETVTVPQDLANTNRSQLVEDVNTALGAAGYFNITASLSSNRLVLSTTGPLAGASILISAPFMDPAVSDLGLTTEPANPTGTVLGIKTLPHGGLLTENAAFHLSINNGPLTLVTINQVATTNNANRDDLITDISDALTAVGIVDVALSIENNRLKVMSTGAQAGAPLFIVADPDDTAAKELGFSPHTQIVTQTSMDLVFLEDLSLSGTIDLGTTDLDAAARFGFVDIGVQNGSAAGQATLAVTPKSNAPKRLTDLFSALENADTYFTRSTGGGVSFNLPTTVNGDLIPLGTAPLITADYSNLFDTGSLSLSYDRLGDLPQYENLDYAQIATALVDFGGFLEILTQDTSQAYNEPLPVLNRTISDLFGLVDVYDDAIAAVTSGAPESLQDVQALLEQAFGGAPTTVNLQALSQDLRITVNYQPPDFDGVSAIDLDLATFAAAAGGVPNLAGVPNLVGGANVDVDAGVEVDLVFGIDLSDVNNPRSYVHDSTDLAATIKVVGAGLDFGAAIGALGIQVKNGTVTYGTGNNPSTLIPAFLNLELDDTPGGRYYNIASLHAGIATSTISGEAHATLPTYHPTPTALFGNIVLDVDDVSDIDGSTTLTAPDFSTAIASLDLLTDLGGLIDGLDQLFLRLDQALRHEALSLVLPVVGDQLADAFTFIDELRIDLVQQLDTAFQGGAGLKDLPTAEAALSTAFGIPVTGIPSPNPTAPDEIQFNVLLTQSFMAAQPIGFELGLPGLGLEIDPNSEITISFDLTFDLRFGINRNDGVYFDTSVVDELEVTLNVAFPGLDINGTLGFLGVDITDSGSDPSTFIGSFTVDLQDPVGTGDRLTLNELLSGAAGPGDLFDAEFNVVADVNLLFVAGFGDDSSLPSFNVDFHLGWAYGTNQNAPAPTVEFNNVRLNLGEFLSGLVSPILSQVTDIFKPLEPIIEVLSTPIPVISDLLKRDVTMIDLAGLFGSGLETAATFVEAVADLFAFAQTLETVGDDVYLDLGSFNFSGLDLSQSRSSPLRLDDLDPGNISGNLDTLDQVEAKAGGFYEASLSIEGGGFRFPLLEDPTIGFRLLFNEDVDLFIYDMPRMDFTFQYTQFIPIYAFIGARIGGSINVTADFSFGYDTFGLRKYSETGQALDLFDGFYVADWVNGEEVPEVTLTGKLLAGVGADVGVASVFIDGGVFASLKFDLNDVEEDGKFRGEEVVSRLQNGIFCLFDIEGEIGGFLQIEIEVGVCPFCISFSQEIARFTLLSFDITCGPPPILASLAPDGTLTLNMGPRAPHRQHAETEDDPNEAFEVTRVSDDIVLVEAFGYAQTYGTVPPVNDPEGPIGPPITSIVANAGDGDDSISIDPVLTDPVFLYGGTGNDLILGGRANDVLEGGGGDDRLRGGNGDDRLYGHSENWSGEADGSDDLQGGNDNDQLYGQGGGDFLFGEFGLDELFGGEGPDQLHGGPEADTLHGGPDGDFLSGDGGNDFLYGDDGDDRAFGGPGLDLLEGGPGGDVLAGEGDTDTLYGHSQSGTGDDNGRDTLFGGFAPGLHLIEPGVEVDPVGDLHDFLYGQGGPDVLLGNEGDDLIYGGPGDDVAYGNTGEDTIYGAEGEDILHGDAGQDIIHGEADNDTVFGGDDFDLIYGEDGDDHLYGDAGDDLIFGEAGDDTIKGGTGRDTLVGGTGEDTIRGQEGDDQVFGQEGADRLYGDAGNDLILGNDQDDYAHGGFGNDRIEGGNGNDRAFGGADDDHLFGEDGADTLYGLEGDDHLDGGDGVDDLFGNEGNDYLIAGAGLGGFLGGGGGNDEITGSDEGADDPNYNDTNYFGDRIDGGAGDDTIWGLGGGDLIRGGEGNDVIDGGADGDWILGDAGHDRLFGGYGADRIEGGTGEDFLDGGADTDLLFGNADDDELLGGGGVGDSLSGGGGDDILRGSDDGMDLIEGGPGRDRVFGNGGNDEINGGPGDDILDGGDGDDTIEGDAGSDLVTGSHDHDTLYGHTASGAGDDHAVDFLYGDFGTNGNEFAAGQDQLFGQGGNDFLYGESGDDFIDPGTGTSDLVDYGTGDGGTPSDFQAPTPTLPPDLVLPLNENASPSMPFGPETLGRWTEYGGSASGPGVSGHPGLSVEPDVAAGVPGTYLAWADARNGNFEIYVVMHAAGAWHTMAGSAGHGGVSNSLRSSRRPSIALDDSGNPVVAWTEYSASGSDIFVASYDPAANGGAGGWISLATSLDPGGISGTGSADNAILLNTGNGLTVAWEDDSSGNAQVYVLRFNGSTWLNVGAGSDSGGGISGAAGGIDQLDFTTDGTKLAAAWTETVGAIDQVFLREFGSGTWNNLAGSASGTGISQASLDATNPAVAYHGGNAFVAWEQARPSNVLPNGIHGKRYTGSSWVDAGTGATTAGGISDSSGVVRDPELASNGGTLHLAWVDETMRINPVALFTRSWDGSAFAEAFAGDAQAQGISETGGQMRAIALAVDPQGHPAIAWEETAASAEVYFRANTFDVSTVYTADANTSVASILAANDLGPGDVIEVAAGSQGGFTVGGNDAGVLILGAPFRASLVQGPVTVSASNVVLQRLGLDGGVSLNTGTDIGVVNSRIRNTGITVNNATVQLLHNTFESIPGNGLRIASASDGFIAHNAITADSVGLDLAAAFAGTIFDNDISQASTGVAYAAPALLRGNSVHDNATGVRVTTTLEADGLGFVGGAWSNEFFGNSVGVELSSDARMRAQHVYENDTGVTGSGVLGGGDFDTANLIEGNATGVDFDGVIQFNRITGNGIGIQAQTGQRIVHNLVYRNTAFGVLASGVNEVEISNNTFYAPVGDNVRVVGGSSAVGLQGNILWAESGYDIYVSNDSQTGFYSDYNDLHVSDAGRIGYWTKDFTDLLDWQADIARFDLHSIGTTVVHPTWSEPAFLNRISNDYRLFGLTAGQRFSSPTIDAADPRADLVLDPSYQNLLVNPGFESGVTSWTVNPGGATAGTNPVSFEGSSYYFSGNVQDGFAEQLVDLTSAGFSAGQLDAQDLELVFGGRVRSLVESALDRGQIRLRFLNGSDGEISQLLIPVENTGDRWVLSGDRVQIPVNTRKIVFRFESLRSTGGDSDSYLDHAFVYVVSEVTSPNQGAYGHTVAETSSTPTHIALRFPDLYTDWEKDKPLTIRWDSFGNIADSPVRIEVYEDDPVHGPALLATIAASTPDDGEHIWIPSTAGIDFGSYGLRIRISLVNNLSVYDRSTEPFTVPEDGLIYYVDDAVNLNDEYTPGAIGSNRHTGKLPTAPKPNPVNLLRTYDLTGGATVNVDTGAYPMIYALTVSGSTDLELGLDEAFTLRGPVDTARTVDLFPAIPGNRFPALIEINDADFVSLFNLDIHEAVRGLYVHNGSGNFNASYLTVYDHSEYGIRIDTDNPATDYTHLTAYDNGWQGIQINGRFASLSDSAVFNNGQTGIRLTGLDGAVLEGNTIYGNGGAGLHLSNSTATRTLVGSRDLSAGRGNILYDNRNGGIVASGQVDVIGNTVSGPGTTGIVAPSEGEIAYNVVHGFETGIRGGGTDAVINHNRVYDNLLGIQTGNPVVTGNVVYSNRTGIEALFGAERIANNLIYANEQDGLIARQSLATEVLNNTFYANGENALRASNITSLILRDNIFYAGEARALHIDPDSQAGVDSDYNLFFNLIGAGVIGHWQNVDRPSLDAWRRASLQDENSLFADPLFVDVAGAGGLTGYVDAADDGRDDDFHLQSLHGSFHGGALAPVIDGASGLPLLPVPVVTNDAAQSPAIDRGHPVSPFANETAENGGYVNLGAYGNSDQASRSPARFILIVRPDGGETVVRDATFVIRWHAVGFAGNVLIETSDSGPTGPFTTLANNEANDGAYDWLVDAGSFAAGTDYAVRISSVNVPAVSDTSAAVFSVVDPITAYYVDDLSNAGDEYTPGATGSDTNDGLSPTSPKASIRDVIETYDLEPGNVLFVDTGLYDIPQNIVLAIQDSGVTIQGPVLAGHEAVLDRGDNNPFGSKYIFEFTGATDVTITGLSLTNARDAIHGGSSANSDRLTIAGNQIYDNFEGISLVLASDELAVIGNEVYNHEAIGIYVGGEDLLVTDNESHDNRTGIYIAGSSASGTVSNNQVYDNEERGIRGDGTVVIQGNTVYGHTGAFHYGIEKGHEVRDNIVYGNEVGINDSTLVIGNRVYGNDIGVWNSNTVKGNYLYSNRVGADTSWTFVNNIVFDHTDYGYLLQGGINRKVQSNTFYEPLADAVRVQGAATGVDLTNNIFRVESGYAVSIETNSRDDFHSDYNLYQLAGTGKLLQWGTADLLTQPDVFFSIGLDEHSVAADPLFVSALGTDGLLGYSVALDIDHSLDNNFHLQSASPAIDTGDPLAYAIEEAAPNGGRLNLGAYGNTPESALSPAELVQVLSPNGGDKLEEGGSTDIDWRAFGLGESDILMLMNVGNITVSWDFGEEGIWLFNNYQTAAGSASRTSSSINRTGVTNPAPQEVYRNYVFAASGIGNALIYDLPVPDGDYELRLHFVEPFSTSRQFDIVLEDQLVLAGYDVSSRAGGRNRAVAEDFSVPVSDGNGLRIQLENLTHSGAILSGIELSVVNPGGVADPTFDIEVSTDNGNSWQPVASGQTIDRFGSGTLAWTAGPQTAEGLIRVSANDGRQAMDTSDESFVIGPPGNLFYVNDGSLIDDEYTTAIGDNANTGKSPDQPVANVSAIVLSYDLDPGDVIYVDTGAYHLLSSILLLEEDGGVTLQGPVGSGHAAMLDGGGDLDFIIEFQNAHGVTVDHLAITGGNRGVGWNSSAHFTNDLTVSNSTIYGNGPNGIGFLQGGNDAQILNNLVYNNGSGIRVDGIRAWISGNEVYSNSSGISYNLGTVENNIVRNNSGNGIAGGLSGSVIRNNQVYLNSGTGISGFSAVVRDNRVYRNHLGISGGERVEHNHVYGNNTFGIQAGNIRDNVVYTNDVGISFSGSSGELSGNLVYDNASEGLRVAGSAPVFNNTVYQPEGDALQVTWNSVRIFNNILWAATGYVIDADNGPESFDSDHNLLFPTGAATLARWGPTDFTTLEDWQITQGFDLNSLVAAPLFVEPGGVDGMLGYDATGMVDHGLDDDFHLQPGSPAIDRGDPLSYFLAEPGPNGGRVNLGSYGNTHEAATSATAFVQVVSPNGLERYSADQQVPVLWHGFGLSDTTTVGLINTGGATEASPVEGYWLQDRYRLDGETDGDTLNQSVDRSGVINPAPGSVYEAYVESDSFSAGEILGYELPVADGDYTLRLHFVEPSYSFPGRVFDIQLQGTLVEDDFDIFVAAGKLKALVQEYSVNASGGSGILLELVNQGGRAVISGIELVQPNPAGVHAPTAELAFSPDNGATWMPIADGLPMNRSGYGETLWTPNVETNGFEGLVRARSELIPHPEDTSDRGFLVANGGNHYFVNDHSTVDDEYTTAVGDNLNAGKTPDQPMASLGILLREYDLGYGDVVFMDTGVYVLTSNIQITGADSGLRLQGPVDLGHAALLDRNEPSFGASAIQLVGANDVTIDRLEIIGGGYGIWSDSGDGGARLVLTNNRIHNNDDGGIFLRSQADAFIEGNETFNNGSGAGITTFGTASIIRNNESYGNGFGISSPGLVEDNLVHDNTGSGIAASAGLIRNNVVFGQTGSSDPGLRLSGEAVAEGNRIYDNAIGIRISSGSEVVVRNNRVYRNLETGIQTFVSATITGNAVYSNPVGIQLNSSFAPSRVFNNLVYGNANQGILVQRGTGHALVNNTVYQAVGDAVKVENNARDLVLSGNILWVDVGQALNVASNSQNGFVSDYNLFYRGPASNGSIGTWSGALQADLSAWQTASSQDANSLSTDPLFVDIDGPDNVLGDPNVPEGDGDDDNFGPRSGSPAIDRGNAFRLESELDQIGQPRRDDPSTPDQGIGWPRYEEQVLGSSLYADRGTPSPSGGDPIITLPFTFPFYGMEYTQFRIAKGSGFIQLGNLSSLGFTSDNDLEGFKSFIRISPLWDNHRLDEVYLDDTVANQYAVRWSGISDESGSAVNFSLTLFDTGAIRFDYGPGNRDLTPLVGVSAGTGFIFSLSAYDGQANLENAHSILWTSQPDLTYYDIGALEFQGDSADVTAPQVVSIPALPASGGSVENTFSSLQVNVTEPLDTISARSVANYALIGAGLDTQFDTNDDVVIALEPAYPFGSTTLTLQWASGVLPEDDYRLTLSGSNAIYDTAGNALDGDANGTPGGDYVHLFTVTNAAPSVAVGLVNQGDIQRSRVAELTIAFSEDVSGSLGVEDFVLEDLDRAALVAPADMTLSYDSQTNFATLSFPGLPGNELPDGNYRLTLLGAGVLDGNGVPLPADFVLPFFVLTGSANGDRVTNDLDLYQVWINLFKAEHERSMNDDLNGDGTVNVEDVEVVAGNYLASLSPPAPLAAPPSSGPLETFAVERQTRAFMGPIPAVSAAPARRVVSTHAELPAEPAPSQRIAYWFLRAPDTYQSWMLRGFDGGDRTDLTLMDEDDEMDLL